MENSVGNKRSRETSPEETPESKRLHAELLFGILEEEVSEAVDRDTEGMDLATVMKSLEDEIAMPAEEIGEGSEAEIGYLLEATDDDLGLPPAATEKWWSEEEVEAVEGYGQIWGFEQEEMDGWCEGMMEMDGKGEEKFGEAEEAGHGFAASFDGGLFDFSDFCWRPESLPTQ